MAKVERRKDHKGRVLNKGESQRKDLTYMYRYKDLDGERKSIYGRTLNELRNKENEINKRLILGLYSTEYTLNQLFDKWIEQTPTLKDRTKRNYKKSYDRWIRDKWIGNKKIKNLVTSDINKFYIELKKSGFADGTICYCDRLIYNPLQMAFDDALIRKNYAVGCGKPYRKTKPKPPLSKEDTIKFLEMAESIKSGKHYLLAFKLMLFTGMRVGEITGLTWDDIYIDKRYLDVNHQFVLGDEYSDTAYHIDVPKTDAGNRKVPISNGLYQLLLELKDTTYESAYLYNTNVDGYRGFVIHTKRGFPVVTSHLNDYAKKVVETYNNTHDDKLPKITCHTCRKTFCTRMAELHLSPHALKSIAGHSSYNTTSDVYISVEDDFVNEDFFRAMGETNIAS